MTEIHCISNESAILGESPVWSARENVVYWIDILGKRLHRTNPVSGETRTWKLPGFAGMIALRRKGGLAIALEDGLYGFDPHFVQMERLVALEADQPENRPNDGKCDAAGRLWVGTMNKIDSNRPTGNFYRIDSDLTVTKIESRFRVPNGLAWGPGEDVMYHTDTRSDILWSYKFNLTSGHRSDKKEFFLFDRDKTGGMDGAAMDIEGGYWAALYGGGKLIRISPEGEQDREIPLPVTQPTMCAFGGRDMKTIFVTSATQKLNAKELNTQPFAGGLLALSVDVKGHEVYPFGG